MIVFTQHALIKLQQRNIKRELVLQTLQKPDRIIYAEHGRICAFKKFRTLRLKVVFIKQAERIIVITQHWVAKAP